MSITLYYVVQLQFYPWFNNIIQSLFSFAFVHGNYSTVCTVPGKSKLTDSTRNSILYPRCFCASRIEFRVSSFEFRDTQRIFQDSRIGILRKQFISRKQNNNNEQ